MLYSGDQSYLTSVHTIEIHKFLTTASVDKVTVLPFTQVNPLGTAVSHISTVASCLPHIYSSILFLDFCLLYLNFNCFIFGVGQINRA